MEVHVKLFNHLRCYAPGRRTDFSIEIPNGASVSSLLQILKIPHSIQRTILVNGRRAEERALFSPGDEVVLMSPVEGG